MNEALLLCAVYKWTCSPSTLFRSAGRQYSCNSTCWFTHFNSNCSLATIYFLDYVMFCSIATSFLLLSYFMVTLVLLNSCSKVSLFVFIGSVFSTCIYIVSFLLSDFQMKWLRMWLINIIMMTMLLQLSSSWVQDLIIIPHKYFVTWLHIYK